MTSRPFTWWQTLPPWWAPTPGGLPSSLSPLMSACQLSEIQSCRYDLTTGFVQSCLSVCDIHVLAVSKYWMKSSRVACHLGYATATEPLHDDALWCICLLSEDLSCRFTRLCFCTCKGTRCNFVTAASSLEPRETPKTVPWLK